MKKKIIYRTLMSCIFITAILLSILAYCGNRSFLGEFKDNKFNKAIVDYGNGIVESYEVKSWADFENSDMVQFTDTDGNTYLTHSSKVVLIYER